MSSKLKNTAECATLFAEWLMRLRRCFKDMLRKIQVSAYYHSAALHQINDSIYDRCPRFHLTLCFLVALLRARWDMRNCRRQLGCGTVLHNFESRPQELLVRTSVGYFHATQVTTDQLHVLVLRPQH